MPFVVLVVFLAAAGTWYFTRQAVGSLQERRLAQLADALRREQAVVGEAEAAGLDRVRRVASNPGLADAMAAGDVSAAMAVLPTAAEAGTGTHAHPEHVTLVSPSPGGPAVLVDLEHGPDPTSSAGTFHPPGSDVASELAAQLRHFDALERVVAGSPGDADDKDSAVVAAAGSLPPALVVAGPIRAVDENGSEVVVGAVVVSTPLGDLVETARAQLGIDTAITAAGGTVVASTFGGDGGPFAGATGVVGGDGDGRHLARSVDWSGGDYTVAAAPLVLRGTEAGAVAAALPDAPVTKSVTATRAQILLLFAGGLVGVLLIGFWVARRMARDVDELADAADAVAGGDFDRRVRERSRDEIGRLAAGFNEMAGRLAGYRAEQEEVIEALRDADRAKDEFIDNLSHELRTPLTPIKGSARLLARGDLDPATREQMADLITANSDRLLEQVNRLIAMSARVQMGEVHAEAVDLPALVAEVVGARVPADQRSRVRVERVRTTLPRASAEIVAVGQVVYDLLDNALKFSEGAVDVGFGTADGWVVVEVADRGPGIPVHEREHVFERFYQVDGSSTRRHGGLGLGLAVASESTRRLGGALEIHGRPGGGTAAVLRLPRDPAGPAEAQADPSGGGLFGLAVKRVPT
ncbi:MAG: HAMP domain-containing sensor histidine kinase [Acidimicrobiia bacterium]